MALTIRVVKDPTTALNKYKAGVASAGPDWAAGALAPKRGDFRVNGAKQQGYWASQVAAAAAKGTYATNLQKVTDASYENAVNTYGQNNYQVQAVAKSAKWGTFYTKFAPALETVIKGLPPRGNFTQNMARLAAYASALNKQKGTFKVV